VRRQRASHLLQLRHSYVDEDHDGGLARSLRPFESNNHRGRINSKSQLRRPLVSVRGTIHFKIDADRRDVFYPCAYRRGASTECRHQWRCHSGFSHANGFLILDEVRSRRHGDLDSSDANRITHWPQSGIGIERGHWCIRCRSRRMDAAREPKYTTETFRVGSNSRERLNYGIAVAPALLPRESNLRTRNASNRSDNPWEYPSIELVVRCERSKTGNSAQPGQSEQLFTPPLPEIAASKVSAVVEHASLALTVRLTCG